LIKGRLSRTLKKRMVKVLVWPLVLNRCETWIGHVLRGDGLVTDVLEGRMLGSRQQGRPTMEMIEELREALMKGNRKENASSGSMKRRAEDGKGWRVFVPRTCLKAEK
jgi:hypothetical protein